jgi:hypothetical protein
MNHVPEPTDWLAVAFVVLLFIALVLLVLAVFDIWVQTYWLIVGVISLIPLGGSLIGEGE